MSIGRLRCRGPTLKPYVVGPQSEISPTGPLSLAVPSLLAGSVLHIRPGLCTRGRPGRKAKPSGRAARGLDSPAFLPRVLGLPS